MFKCIDYPVATFGVRYKSLDGWRIYEWPKTYEAVISELTSDQSVIDVRIITEGFSCRRDEDGNPVIRSGSAELTAYDFGWAYDPSSNLFRAPGELLKQPSGGTAIAKKCNVKITGPQNGWASLCLAVNEAEYLIHCSDVFDPFPELIRWLENIASKKSSRILINEEGCYSGLSSYNVDVCTIRLVVHSYCKYIAMEIDCLIGRMFFVKQLYDAIQSFSQNREVSHKGWSFHEYNNCKIDYRNLRSRYIEKFLTRYIS
jgi:hypothetical protein